MKIFRVTSWNNVKMVSKLAIDDAVDLFKIVA